MELKRLLQVTERLIDRLSKTDHIHVEAYGHTPGS
jgi:hypothetical protein